MPTLPILVAYASRAGSTHEIAEAVGRTLGEHGAAFKVRSVKDVTDLE
jgi:menaquinone-dependent protoporphyrinogen IX oxidase